MKLVLFLMRARVHATNAKFQGFCQVARRFGWRVQSAELADFARNDIAHLVDFWDPDGVAIDCGGFEKPPALAPFGATPVVLIGLNPAARSGLFAVCADPRAEARLAAKELLQLDGRRYAFVGFHERRVWSDERRRNFQEALRTNGRDCLTFDLTLGDTRTLSAWERKLRAWIRRLPKPCAIYTPTDVTASKIANICMTERIRVPDDVAVLGCNNDEELCLSSRPHLSSILQDYGTSGALAARLLAARFHSRRMKPTSRLVPPVMVVRRESTRGRVPDDDIERARALIREKACKGLRARDVVAAVRGSRRHAEMRFRQVTGHSILDEIQSVRIAQARQLLAGSGLPVKTVAQMCGYASADAFRRLYRATFGVSPRERMKRTSFHVRAGSVPADVPSGVSSEYA